MTKRRVGGSNLELDHQDRTEKVYPVTKNDLEYISGNGLIFEVCLAATSILLSACISFLTANYDIKLTVGLGICGGIFLVLAIITRRERSKILNNLTNNNQE